MKIEDIKVSTKTIIATSNCKFDIVKIFQEYPLKERNGRVEIMYYQNNYKGIVNADFNPKKKKSFRNAINIISDVDGKKVNFKLSKNGKFQLTGCKFLDHALVVVKCFLQNLLIHCPDCVEVSGEDIQVFFQTVMTNIDFPLGFAVDRQKLDDIMNKSTPFHSLLETSFGYTGVNIKFPLDKEWWDLKLPVIRCSLKDLLSSPVAPWVFTEEKLSSIIPITDDILKKKKYNTFLVFHSGSVIMSGMMKETMEEHYNLFISIMKTWQPKIEEKLVGV